MADHHGQSYLCNLYGPPSKGATLLSDFPKDPLSASPAQGPLSAGATDVQGQPRSAMSNPSASPSLPADIFDDPFGSYSPTVIANRFSGPLLNSPNSAKAAAASGAFEAADLGIQSANSSPAPQSAFSKPPPNKRESRSSIFRSGFPCELDSESWMDGAENPQTSLQRSKPGMSTQDDPVGRSVTHNTFRHPNSIKPRLAQSTNPLENYPSGPPKITKSNENSFLTPNKTIRSTVGSLFGPCKIINDPSAPKSTPHSDTAVKSATPTKTPLSIADIQASLKTAGVKRSATSREPPTWRRLTPPGLLECCPYFQDDVAPKGYPCCFVPSKLHVERSSDKTSEGKPKCRVAGTWECTHCHSRTVRAPKCPKAKENGKDDEKDGDGKACRWKTAGFYRKIFDKEGKSQDSISYDSNSDENELISGILECRDCRKSLSVTREVFEELRKYEDEKLTACRRLSKMVTLNESLEDSLSKDAKEKAEWEKKQQEKTTLLLKAPISHWVKADREVVRSAYTRMAVAGKLREGETVDEKVSDWEKREGPARREEAIRELRSKTWDDEKAARNVQDKADYLQGTAKISVSSVFSHRAKEYRRVQEAEKMAKEATEARKRRAARLLASANDSVQLWKKGLEESKNIGPLDTAHEVGKEAEAHRKACLDEPNNSVETSKLNTAPYPYGINYEETKARAARKTLSEVRDKRAVLAEDMKMLEELEAGATMIDKWVALEKAKQQGKAELERMNACTPPQSKSSAMGMTKLPQTSVDKVSLDTQEPEIVAEKMSKSQAYKERHRVSKDEARRAWQERREKEGQTNAERRREEPKSRKKRMNSPQRIAEDMRQREKAQQKRSDELMKVLSKMVSEAAAKGEHLSFEVAYRVIYKKSFQPGSEGDSARLLLGREHEGSVGVDRDPVKDTTASTKHPEDQLSKVTVKMIRVAAAKGEHLNFEDVYRKIYQDSLKPGIEGEKARELLENEPTHPSEERRRLIKAMKIKMKPEAEAEGSDWEMEDGEEIAVDDGDDMIDGLGEDEWEVVN